jgi:creatinine amidohydrolase
VGLFSWAELDRRALARILPGAVLIIPLGSVEQHGDHLPTGTDHLLSSAVVNAAAEQATTKMGTDIVVAPTLTYGASDHHLPFGGTLSLRPQTLLAMLADILASAATAHAERVVLVNGHGGNSGICHAAAAAASARHGLTVAHVDYWKMLSGGDRFVDAPIPGHAGAFETSMVLATRPELVRERPDREEPPSSSAPRGLEVHSAKQWTDMNGFSDHPERATVEAGEQLMRELASGLATALVEFAEGSR